MRLKQPKIKTILPKAISAFLVFWLSSVLVLACCGWGFLTAPASILKVEEAESCPLGNGHECCDKAKNETSSKSFSKNKTSIDCCVFKPQKTLSSEPTGSKNVKQSLVLIVKEKPQELGFFIKKSIPTYTYLSSFINNNQNTYLRNCVFRI